MTSISAFSTSMAQSPRAQMTARLDSAVAAGKISATDQGALTSALDTIDTSLKSSAGSGAKTSMKDKIGSLIDQQVTAGSLTDDQASELKSLFAQGAPGAGRGQFPPPQSDDDDTSIDAMGGAGAARGPRGHGGPPPSASKDDDDDSSKTTSTAQSVDQQLATMEKFLEKLRASFANNATYGAASATTSATTSGLVVNSVA